MNLQKVTVTLSAPQDIDAQLLDDFFSKMPDGAKVDIVREISTLQKRCPCECDKLPEFSVKEAEAAGVALGYINLDTDVLNNYEDPEHLIPNMGSKLEKLRTGMQVEREHCDVTHGDPLLTARIALSHLREDEDYYWNLKKAGL
ncbi:MAG: DUF5661 family protein [Dehalococcoidia bacterium]|nr:DUF5661 family protein [Dehalococcoidia bacterium]